MPRQLFSDKRNSWAQMIKRVTCPYCNKPGSLCSCGYQKDRVEYSKMIGDNYVK